MNAVWNFLSNLIQSCAQLWSWLSETEFDFLGHTYTILDAVSTSLLVVLGVIIVAKLIALVIPN